MILLDTNIILRHLVEPDDEASLQMAKASTSLFREISAGREEATISEVVVHEVCFVLASKHHYGLTGQEVRALVAPLFELRGFKLLETDRRIFLRALDIFAEDQKLGSGDALVLARCEIKSLRLATHDRRMGRFASVVKWQPIGDIENLAEIDRERDS